MHCRQPHSTIFSGAGSELVGHDPGWHKALLLEELRHQILGSLGNASALDQDINNQFAAMAGQLHRISGRFILSINDVPEIRRLFHWAEIEPVATTYTVGGGGKAKKARELIIGGRT